MKRLLFILLLFTTWFAYGQEEAIPELNRKIRADLETMIGTKVDRGECWDLANKLLTRAGADWNHKYKYGKAIDPDKETVYPGDMIQLENVQLKYKKGNKVIQETYGRHTAVVYEVLEEGVYKIAHQNNGYSGKKVGISKLRLDNLEKGKLKFYRPVK